MWQTNLANYQLLKDAKYMYIVLYQIVIALKTVNLIHYDAACRL